MNATDILFMTDREIAERFGKMAKERRKRLGLGTQEKFAKRIGMSSGSYRRFEQTGAIGLEDFIAVMRHLDLLKNVPELIKEDPIEETGLDAYLGTEF